MLFNSLPFLFLFLPSTVLGFHLLGRFGRRPVLLWLTAASLVFYAAWNPPFLLVLLGSITLNFLISRRIASASLDSPARSRWLTFGIAANLLLLFRFKYLHATLLFLIGRLHLPLPSPHPILLPLGISFFTFTQISFLVDLAQDQAELQGPLAYTLFVTFFPHLIAGPILHHREMMPQFSAHLIPGDPSSPLRHFRLRRDDLTLGLSWFVLGLAKKVLVADALAPAADISFTHAGHQTAAAAWVGLVTYSMQLYFDFSGYSDMALGLARMLSIHFPFNFDSPFQATSITEYWQRWHITLTRYITLYLYNPFLLAIQRRRARTGRKVSRKALRTPSGFLSMIAAPTLLTMLLTGIWHGAGLQFLLFGLLHGVYLTANQAWRHFRPTPATSPNSSHTSALRRFPLQIGVYLQVVFALIFFRAASTPAAFSFLADLFGRHGGPGNLSTLTSGALAFALFPVVWFLPNTQTILGQEPASEPAIAARTLAAQPALTKTGAPGIASDTRVPAPNVFTAPPQPNPGSLPAGPAPDLALPWSQRLLHHLRWQPTLPWALVLAILLFACLTNLDTNVPFLYFQF